MYFCKLDRTIGMDGISFCKDTFTLKFMPVDCQYALFVSNCTYLFGVLSINCILFRHIFCTQYHAYVSFVSSHASSLLV